MESKVISVSIKNLIKKIPLIFGYSILFLVGVNFYIAEKENSNSLIYERLFEAGYYKSRVDPYSNAFKLKLHPTNYFSLPYTSSEKNQIKNYTFSLDKYGYRNNPYIINDKRKHCIIFLGSSASFGVGVSKNSMTMPALLNKKLGQEYNVYNLSVPSWNSRQELVSLINFLNKDIRNKCNVIDTISYTGNTDKSGIIYSMKNNLYKDIDSRNELISSPENFNILSSKVKDGKNSKSNLKHNIISSIKLINKSLFGNLTSKYKTIIEKQLKNDSYEIKLGQQEEIFIDKQIESFFINHKIINNITKDIGGKYLLIIQPNISKNKSYMDIYKYSDDQLNKYIKKINCLNILDLRNSINEYIISNRLESQPLKEAIKIKKNINYDDYIYFDYSTHLTDSGSLLTSQLILEKYNKITNKAKCKI